MCEGVETSVRLEAAAHEQDGGRGGTGSLNSMLGKSQARRAKYKYVKHSNMHSHSQMFDSDRMRAHGFVSSAMLGIPSLGYACTLLNLVARELGDNTERRCDKWEQKHAMQKWTRFPPF